MSPAGRRKPEFNIVGGPVTAPSAEPAATQDAVTPRRQGVEKSSAAPSRAAFTWRRTPEQALAMDEITIRLKRQLGRPKLDHAEILAALVGIASDSPPVFGALVARLQQNDA
jgi:hypothetical protein